ncbi:MAG: O-antigen ligase family protein [Clostridiales Family XIII bacterium]|jgi:O-antigen ligase|nr:O-antigen ligase family protein [Clostridiales Family XIII bacterium]
MSKNKSIAGKNKKAAASPAAQPSAKDPSYLLSMSHAHSPDESVYGFQLVPAVLFTAIVIVVIRMFNYSRDMSSFYWSGSSSSLVDFFSHYKVVLIVISAVTALLMLLYRLCTQSLTIRKSAVYIPMAIYVFFVLLSYLMAESQYKVFAWHGWNDRFEGTYTILCYMFMLFYIINSVNTERNVKWIIYPLSGVTILLSALGLSQFLDHDFFRTTMGQKLLLPNYINENGVSSWEMVDRAAEGGKQFLTFTFQNREIYQTVYNINYVSFYLTLLIPLFGMLFIREKHMVKKVFWGLIVTIILINLIGSASSGGIFGMFFVVLTAVITLRTKLLKWWKSVTILLVLTACVAYGTHNYMLSYTGNSWFVEVQNAVTSVLNLNSRPEAAGLVPGTPSSTAGSGAIVGQTHLDYFENKGDDIIFSVDGNEAVIKPNPEDSSDLSVLDSDGNELSLISTKLKVRDSDEAENSAFTIDDERFSTVILFPATSGGEDDSKHDMCIFKLADNSQLWAFFLTDDGTYYYTETGSRVKLSKIPTMGWKNNLSFGSGRGFIWSRTIPMMKETIFVGHGADTYAIYFPHNDYVGKHNAGWNITTIVDKPHNMYFGAAIGTGVLSVLALIAMFIIYFIQSICIYFRSEIDDFCSIVGAGIFFGVVGFAFAGIVDDSTVSVMPLFYGLIGLGIAINSIIKRRNNAANGVSQA